MHERKKSPDEKIHVRKIVQTKKKYIQNIARRKNAGRKKARRKSAVRKSADEKMADENLSHEKMS